MTLLGFVTIAGRDVHNQVTVSRNLGALGEGESLEILVHLLHHLLQGRLLLLGLGLFPGRSPLSSGGRNRIKKPLEALLLLQALQGEGRGDVMFVELGRVHPLGDAGNKEGNKESTTLFGQVMHQIK